MEEFATSVATGMMLSAPFDMDANLFYELDNGYALFTKPIVAKQQFSVGDRILSAMLEGYWLLNIDGDRIGYLFTSQFHTVNGGGYLLSYMESKRGTATVSRTLMKTEDLVVIDYPNKGTIAISPAIGEETTTIFEEQ